MSSVVVTGVRDLTSVVRSPAESELPRAFQVARAQIEANPPKKGEVVFVANGRNYRFQLTCPPQRTDPATGLPLNDPPRCARFSGYLYRTSDPWEIQRLKSDRFYNIEFWDAVEKVAAENKAIQERLVASIAAQNPNPDQVADIVARLQALTVKPGKKGFDLPPKKGDAGASTEAKS